MSDTIWLAIITGIFGLLNAILAAWVLRSNGNIHTIVNQQRTDMIAHARSQDEKIAILESDKQEKAIIARVLAEKVPAIQPPST